MSDVEVEFGAQTGDVARELANLNAQFKTLFSSIKRDIKGMSDVVQAEVRQSNAALRQLHDKNTDMVGVFGKVKTAAAGLFVAMGIQQVAQYVVQTTVEFERLRAVLTTMEGANAGARFEALKKFAAETPYDLAQVVQAFSFLKSQGLDPSNEALRSYGNTAAAMGKSLDQFVQAVGDAAVGEMERLKEFGILAKQEGDKVTFTFKGVSTTVGRNAAEIQGYLQDIGNTDFAGSMERQMKTLGGAFSNLADTAAVTADAVGQGGLSDALSLVAKEMTGSAEESGKFAGTLGSVLGDVVITVWELCKGFGEGVGQIFKAIGDVIRIVTGNSSKDFDSFGASIKFIRQLLAALSYTVRVTFTGIAGAIRGAVVTIVGFAAIADRALSLDWEGTKAAWNNWKGSITSTVNDTVGNVRNAISDLNSDWARIGAPPKVAQTGGVLDNSTITSKSSAAGKGKTDKGAASRAAAEARRQAKEELDAYLEGIRAKQEAAEANYEEVMRLEEEKIQRIKTFYGEDSKEYASALREKANKERRHQQEMNVIAKEGIEYRSELNKIDVASEAELGRMRLDAERQRIEDMASLGQISSSEKLRLLGEVNKQEYALQTEHENRMYQLEVQALRDKLDLMGLEPKEVERINREIEILTGEHNARMRALNQGEVVRQQQQDRQIWAEKNRIQLGAINSMSQSWGNALAMMATGQATFAETVRAMWQGIVGAITQAIAQMIAQWIAQQLIAAIFGKAIGGTTAASQIVANAGVAASGAYAATAMIPIIGPAIAPAAAATALAGAMAFLPMAFAAKGYDIPSGVNPLTQLHEEEMVLPKNIANPLRAMLAGPQRSDLSSGAALAGRSAASAGGVGGDIHYHDNTERGLTPSQIVSNRAALAKAIKMAHREGRFVGAKVLRS